MSGSDAMATHASRWRPTQNPAAVRKYSSETAAPQPPAKIILEDHSLVEVFRRSAAFQRIIAYVQGCSEAVESTPNHQRLSATVDDCDDTVRYLVTDYLPRLHDIVTAIPLEDMAQQRFGNRAKRVFHARLEETVVADMEKLVRTFPTSAGRSEEAITDMATEVAAYVMDSFGNATRLDYGSGHELHFFIVIMICLEEHGDGGGSLKDEPAVLVPLEVPPPPPVPPMERAEVRKRRQDYIFYIFHEYMRLVRRLQKRYSLEPAGSHGVWGLDDYHHIPYIFGGAQLINAEVQPVKPAADQEAMVVLPKHICDRAKVEILKDSYLYFSMIAWILENKTGPFHEHSNMLYNISGVEHWSKIYSGMVKMFAAEVLAKFNVSQHLLFGRHLPWNTKTM
ncbi:protein phosphatase 2A - regulatory subunit B [Leishmania donovani]|uniref:Serine/threonine-protein phosphatase 2A activator n=3 Tax=Leishmania donovani species complex TaxID=38574 RepID=A0A6L0WIC4_LEIIN|nr:putative phosphotyrosyl phosphate activator protein [Leishmania infantum JPCM5]CAC9448003.1 protein_phosphatase_2A_-_regulatory_subunit_B_-_putative [Leishmania infantum]CAJ1986254.1 protein phosphatase 2A - regulatory subunit B [Leishmania donovani]CAM65582.1 putative phosphotyrosyl phosphate activator protein [Leishmania infantum JPCM5]SUZ39205.1 protein_phosphatase_2A_-_regulatory_subunit_B_-_putative [Leishmania infantum]VDZ42153.1 protein_phosphatase_2A_regulatory_subunit_B_putative/Ge|eukprot:XP_001463228.1 putative phosphotyrosyl phosphate activator protein [Leishmania infantum JPCM5]